MIFWPAGTQLCSASCISSWLLQITLWRFLVHHSPAHCLAAEQCSLVSSPCGWFCSHEGIWELKLQREGQEKRETENFYQQNYHPLLASIQFLQSIACTWQKQQHRTVKQAQNKGSEHQNWAKKQGKQLPVCMLNRDMPDNLAWHTGPVLSTRSWRESLRTWQHHWSLVCSQSVWPSTHPVFSLLPLLFTSISTFSHQTLQVFWYSVKKVCLTLP